MSAFNDLLSLFRLDVSLYHNARVCGNWQINEHELGSTCFHMPTQGGCFLVVPGEGEWKMAEGDLVIFPKEIPHTITPLTPLEGTQRHLPIPQSQDIPGTSMLCGAVKLVHRSSQHLMAMLPPVMVISHQKAKHWLAPLAQLILAESMRNASLESPVLNRLSELLFAYSLRCYAENFEHKSGVLALYIHPRLAPSIKAIHAKPDYPWQLASLASECAMSRTQFSKLFTEVSGNTAMQYLTWWRMQLAWTKLSAGATVEATAEEVGYRSTAAFSRAFKAEFGETVGAVRNSLRHAA